MKKFSLALLLAVNLFAAAPIQSTVQELSWPKGDSFLTFLEKNSIPLKLYYDLDSEDKEFLDEIKEGISYQISRDENGGISQVLIPVNEELQAQIYKDNDGGFKFQLSPISYQTYDRVLSMPVSANPSQDIIETTGSVALAHGFYLAMKGEVDDGEFKRLKKGDRLAMSYKQKIRLGRTFGMPEIDWAAIEIRGKRYTVYRHQNKYYDKSGKKSDKFLLTRPISNARITSPFTPKRFHPILKRYKAHLGVDYGAPKGTPIKAAGEGTVKFVGTKSGYGKVVILKHAGAYETLYAHTNGFAKGIKTGVKVKQGQLIAYVGNTGMSTGSHLHFGVYKNGTAVNPETEIKVAKSVFFSKEEKEFKNRVERLEPEIKKALSKDRIPEKEHRFDAAMDWEHPIAEPKSDVNSTLANDDLNLTAQPNAADANLTAADANLTSELASGSDDANLMDSNLTKSESNLTAQPKAENNSSEPKTDANETTNLAAAKSAKPEPNLTSAKASNKATSKTEPKKSSKEVKKSESNSSAKNNKDKPKQADKKKDKPSQETKAESKKKKDVNASKDKSKKQKDAADKKAKSKGKTAESSDKKSK